MSGNETSGAETSETGMFETETMQSARIPVVSQGGRASRTARPSGTDAASGLTGIAEATTTAITGAAAVTVTATTTETTTTISAGIAATSDRIRNLARELGFPAERAKRRRARFLIVLGACCAGLVPWIVYLAVSMPTGYRAEAWSAAWVGFDVLLLLALVGTVVAALFGRQVVILLAVVSATLLLCDAWFDVVLDWGTPDLWGSIASAAFVELPLALFLLAQARMLVRISVRIRWHELGLPGDPPALHRIPLLLTGRPADQ